MVAPESPAGGQVTRTRQSYRRKMLNRLRRRCREDGVEPLGGRRWEKRRRRVTGQEWKALLAMQADCRAIHERLQRLREVFSLPPVAK